MHCQNSDDSRVIRRKKHIKGFSLLELIVALSIFILLTATFFFNYNSFNRRTNLDTLAHQIGQWVRNAQVSGISVRRAHTGSSVYPGYGIHFASSTPDRFVYFADLNGNRAYDSTGSCGGVSDECVQEIVLLQGNRIASLCGETAGAVSTSDCADPLGSSDIFDIMFIPPDPDAVIIGDLNGASYPTNYTRARITVSPLTSDYRRSVEVWTTGQVSIQ